ncbi:MAG: hypothetical protein ACOY9D_04160 [Pseudomonadota bacterium]
MDLRKSISNLTEMLSMRSLAQGLMAAAALITSTLDLACAQDDSIYGTVKVTYQPVLSLGNTWGCTFVYAAVYPDSVYLKGTPVAIDGNISLFQFGEKLGLQLKIGVKKLAGVGSIKPPNYAYLETDNYSTAKARQVIRDGDAGYRLFDYFLYDSSVIGVYNEMLASGKVTIAFNRKKDGMDVLVPVDLRVIDSEVLKKKKVHREISDKSLHAFAECAAKLTYQAEQIKSGK